MSPQATPPEVKTRAKRPSVRITEQTQANLDKYAQKVTDALKAQGVRLPTPDHGQIVALLVEEALESDNGAS